MIVTGTLTDPSGRPLQRHRVTIGLVAPGNPFTDMDSAVINARSWDTDTDGTFEADLIPTDQYEYEGATYRVDARGQLGNEDALWHITVPSVGGPYDFRDLLVADPAVGEPVPPVTAHGLGTHTDVQIPAAAERTDGYVVAWDDATQRFVLIAQTGGGTGAVDSVDGRTGVVTLADVYAPVVHGHSIAQVANLPDILDTLASDVAASLTQAEADALYAALSHVHTFAGVTGLQDALDTLTADVAARLTQAEADALYAAIVHGHPISQITGLQAALDGKEDDGAATAAVAAHVAEPDPHPQYITATEDAAALDSRIILIDNVASLPPGTPADVIVVVKD